jgi:Glycosyl transferase family 1
VIANAGFTLASECLHLGIAVLLKPIDGHLEQESNALALEQLALGTVTRRLSHPELSAWLERPAPTAQNYPDVTAAIVGWLDDGAVEPLGTLSARLWASRQAP